MRYALTSASNFRQKKTGQAPLAPVFPIQKVVDRLRQHRPSMAEGCSVASTVHSIILPVEARHSFKSFTAPTLYLYNLRANTGQPSIESSNCIHISIFISMLQENPLIVFPMRRFKNRVRKVGTFCRLVGNFHRLERLERLKSLPIEGLTGSCTPLLQAFFECAAFGRELRRADQVFSLANAPVEVVEFRRVVFVQN